MALVNAFLYLSDDLFGLTLNKFVSTMIAGLSMCYIHQYCFSYFHVAHLDSGTSGLV